MSALSDEKLARELEAQKKRVVALKYLASQGQNVDTSEKVIQNMAKQASQSDNTLELMLKQRATSADTSRDLEKRAKAALLQSQDTLRSGLSNKPSSSSASNEPVSVRTNEEWEEIVDRGSMKSYYWNQTTNETRWEKPEGALILTKRTKCGGDDWKAAVHPATNQEYWINSRTGEKRFEAPTTSSSEAATKSVPSETKAAASSNKNKRKYQNIDPLDPTGGQVSNRHHLFVLHIINFCLQGADRYGEAKDGRMADRLQHILMLPSLLIIQVKYFYSTAGGALWQQRPYPAPSKALLARKKPEASQGPIFMAPKK
jgi:hypothetical protein